MFINNIEALNEKLLPKKSIQAQLQKKHQIHIFRTKIRNNSKLVVSDAFVSDDALMKILYLTTMQIVDRWTMPIRDWDMILDNLMVYFGNKVNIAL